MCIAKWEKPGEAQGGAAGQRQHRQPSVRKRLLAAVAGEQRRALRARDLPALSPELSWRAHAAHAVLCHACCAMPCTLCCAVQEYYEYIEAGGGDIFRKLGAFAWLAVGMACAETLVVIKYADG